MNMKLVIIEDNPQMRQTIRAVVADLATPVTGCDTSSANVRMITPEETAALAQVAVRTIYRWVEA